MKIHPVGTELFHAGRWTDGLTEMTKQIVAFRYFANAAKNEVDSVRTSFCYAKLNCCAFA